MNEQNEIQGDMREDVEGFNNLQTESEIAEFEAWLDEGDDGQALASAGHGTDEDYGSFGGEDDWLDGSYES